MKNAEGIINNGDVKVTTNSLKALSLKLICNAFSQNWWVVSSCLLQYKPVCVTNFDKFCRKMLKRRSLVIFLAWLFFRNHLHTWYHIRMHLLWPPYVTGGPLYFCPVISFYLSSFYLFLIPRLISAAADSMSTILLHMVWPSANLECRSEICYMRFAANAGPKKVAKNRHIGTIGQLCRAISSQLRHISTIWKKNFVKQQYLLRMSPQYGEVRPTSGWDRFVSLGHPR